MRTIMLVLASALSLTACGGGTAGSATTAAPVTASDPGPTLSLLAAFGYLDNRQDSRTFVVSGTRDNSTATVPVPVVGLSGSGTLSKDAASTTLYNGGGALKSTQVLSGTIVANGQATPIDATRTTYTDARSFSRIAQVDNGITSLISAYSLPTAVQVGSSGSLGNGVASGLTPSLSTASYAIGRDSSTSLLLTIVENVTVAGVQVTTVSTVYRLHLNGSGELVSITSGRFTLGRLFETVVFTFN